MKRNPLNVVLMSSAVLLAICGCTPSTTNSSDISTPDSSGPVFDDSIKVELKRNIFLVGEKITYEEATVSKYSKVYNEYTQVQNFNITMPETCPNGEAYITVTVGISQTSVPIKYYDSIEKAVEDNPITLPEDVSKYYDESKYIKNGKLTFSTVMHEGTLLITDPNKSSTILKSAYNAATVNPTYNANYIDAWTEEGASPAVLDPTRKTIPHLVTVQDDGSEVVQTHTTYYPTGEYTQCYMYEIITEADGSIAYYAPINNMPSNVDPILPTDTERYWSKYKDYTQNPCFIYADDYDVENNPTAFEKVLPEGGQWIIGVNNVVSLIGKIDGVFQEMTGDSSLTCNNSRTDIKLTYGDPEDLDDAAIENNLMNAKVMCVVNSRGTPAVGVYSVATPQYSYAYYAQKANTVSDATLKAELLADKELVYNYMIYLLLPEVVNEPVLYKYYTQKSNEKIAEWVSKFPA